MEQQDVNNFYMLLKDNEIVNSSEPNSNRSENDDSDSEYKSVQESLDDPDDDGYHTETSFDSEVNGKVDKLIIKSNSNSILKPEINYLLNKIIIKRIKNRLWKIEQETNDNNKIIKNIVLKKEENDILENLIKEYKREIIITFDKNTKKFKQAFIIDDKGNKKNIVIKASEIRILEKLFIKITKILATPWNDSCADIANNFEKEQSLSKPSKLKNHSEKKCWKYLRKI